MVSLERLVSLYEENNTNEREGLRTEILLQKAPSTGEECRGSPLTAAEERDRASQVRGQRGPVPWKGTPVQSPASERRAATELH